MRMSMLECNEFDAINLQSSVTKRCGHRLLVVPRNHAKFRLANDQNS